MEIKQSTRESVKVLASFQPKSIRIYFSSWCDRTYKVDSMDMFHISRDADKHLYHFAVSANNNTSNWFLTPLNYLGSWKKLPTRKVGRGMVLHLDISSASLQHISVRNFLYLKNE